MSTYTLAASTNGTHLVITNSGIQRVLPFGQMSAYLDSAENLILKVSGEVAFSAPISSTDLSGATAALKMTTLKGIMFGT